MQPAARIHAWRFALGLGALVALHPNAARAAEFGWDAPAECGDDASVRTQVEQLAKRSLATVESIDFEVQITRSSDSEWHAVLRARARPSGPERVRELAGSSCRVAKDALAVAMAMTITASERAAPSPSPSEAPHASPPPSAPAPVEPRPPAPATRAVHSEPARVRGAIGLGFALDTAWLPATAPGAALELALRWYALRFSVVGAAFLPQAARLPTRSEGADFGLVRGALLACYEIAPAGISWLACGGCELSWLSVEAVRLTGEPRGRLAYGLLAELGLVWPLARTFGVSVRLGAAAPLRRNEFVVDDRDVLHQPNVAGFSARLGLEYGF